MNNSELAVSLFQQGFNCAQAVIAVFSADLGLDRETALRLASGFGGGIARTGETCGAVTGSIMAIGLKHGMTSAGDLVAKQRTYEVVGEFLGVFKQRHDSLRCKDLLGCDVSTPEGLAMVKEKYLHAKVCSGLILDAIEILETLLRFG